MSGRTRTRPATLWIGPSLSALEHLCLASFVRHDMAPVLFSYGDVANVPDGIERRDANEILPESAIWTNLERASVAPFSDYFRYKLLGATDFYWVDADVFALRTFDFDTDYFLAYHPPVVGITVLSLPRQSPSLAAVTAAAEAPHIDLPWLARDRQNLAAVAGPNGQIAPEHLPYKALGPRALTWLMRHHNELGHVLGPETHYPLLPRQIMRPFLKCERLVDWENAFSVHLFGSVQTRWFAEHGTRHPPEGSFLAELYQRHDIDPTMR